jgi:hypothetical protein
MTESEGARTGHDTPVSSTASRLFDLRTVLAVLFAVYGLVLLILGLATTTDADIAKAGGFNINLETGIAMLVVAVLFGLWVRVRPTRAPGATGDGAGPTGH